MVSIKGEDMYRKAVLLAALLVAGGVYAESITHGSTTINMDFVNIGYAGNTADIHYSWNPRGYGAVDYNYRIGKHEVSIAQFMAVQAADDRVGNGNENYWNDGTRTVGANAPASFVTWYEAAMFCNWLTTGDAHTGAYQFDGGGTLQAVDRDSAVAYYGTVYVLPSEDEWYKAAYYKPINDGSYSLYSNGSDVEDSVTHGTTHGWNYNKYVMSNDYLDGLVNDPTNVMWETGFGAEEQNGTHDMMGNLWEFNESAFDGNLANMDEYRVFRGGDAYTNFYMASPYRHPMEPEDEWQTLGFRVAAIPEPSSVVMIGFASGCAAVVRRRFPSV
jgi:formylglycine-generating enzyme required for sulfatase activity